MLNGKEKVSEHDEVLKMSLLWKYLAIFTSRICFLSERNQTLFVSGVFLVWGFGLQGVPESSSCTHFWRGKGFSGPDFSRQNQRKRSSSMETHQHSLMVRILSYHQLKLEGTLNPCLSNCSWVPWPFQQLIRDGNPSLFWFCTPTPSFCILSRSSAS